MNFKCPWAVYRILKRNMVTTNSGELARESTAEGNSALLRNLRNPTETAGGLFKELLSGASKGASRTNGNPKGRGEEKKEGGRTDGVTEFQWSRFEIKSAVPHSQFLHLFWTDPGEDVQAGAARLRHTPVLCITPVQSAGVPGTRIGTDSGTQAPTLFCTIELQALVRLYGTAHEVECISTPNAIGGREKRGIAKQERKTDTKARDVRMHLMC
ncbi:hypothetical protein DFH08DRAFT_806059 [Mycena albidolilacea]|uniref:Uncharacterized protein n=1 Tax=Mycena albidolilacea TaxID=1033008 RepID=A0AAD7EW12_9AGAR|nr:hypothetical protein DFH08DRAFT_806059 [Mycena albidolilacea]